MKHCNAISIGLIKLILLAEKQRTIEAHKFMLIAASPVFEAMFCGPLQENGDVEVSDIDPESFEQMLK